MKSRKNLLLLILFSLNTLAAFANGNDDKEKIFINKRSSGTVAFAFNSEGNVHYIIDYADGSYYEYEGTYRSINNKIDIKLEEGHGENSAGIEMNHLKPYRTEIHLLIKGDVLIDNEYHKNVVFMPLKEKGHK